MKALHTPHSAVALLVVALVAGPSVGLAGPRAKPAKPAKSAKKTAPALPPTTSAPTTPPAAAADFPKYGTRAFALAVLERVDDQYRGNKSEAEMSMYIKTKYYTRSLTMRTWSLGKDHSLVRILAPKKEAGSATLKSGKNLFSYLGKTGRTIKISGGMMGGNWMGSHLTNDDLVHETRLSEDFVIKQLADGKSGDQLLWRFSMTPKPNVPVVWGRIDVEVRASDKQPASQTFYDEEMVKVRTLTFSNYRTFSGRKLPTVVTVTPNDKPGELTRITYKSLNFAPKIDRTFFSLQRLKSL